MNIHFWGATDEVTGSMTFLDLPDGKILIDCGLTQGTDEVEKLNSLALPYSPNEVKAIILTHAHLDHSGYLPRIVKKGFRGQIHCTPATAKLARIILLDSAKLNEDEFYEEEDVQQTLQLIKTHEWNDKFDLLGAKVHFISAGHILGASSVVLSMNNKKIVFSGDLGRFKDPILLPYKPCPAADIIVMESTYGGKVREGDMEKELHSFLMTISRESRVGIVASFAVARAQTLLTLIHEFFERHPEEKIRVVMDSPMMREANKVYQQFSHLTSHAESLYTALDKIDSIDFQKEWESLRKKKGPLVVISSSGMLTGGRIARHLYNWHDDESAILFLPGYQGLGTPGRRMIEGQRSLLGPNDEPFEWKGEVWNSDAFSSHADQQELITWVSENNKTPKVFLLHGEKTSKEALKAKLSDCMDVTIPERGTKYLFFLALLFLSCSRVNVASQDHYRSQHMRHGIIPLTSDLSKKFSEASVARGKILYRNNCLSCHGENGKGDGPIASNQKSPPANLQKLAREVSDFKFFMSISEWQGDMPGWNEQFNDIDREDLVAYLKTFK